MKYRVSDEEFDTPEEAVDYCIDADYHRDDDYFEEWVNDTYGSICIAGDTYYAYNILDNAGDGNLSYLLDEFCEQQNQSDIDDASYELNHGTVGDQVECQGYTIYIIEDDIEEDTDGDEKLNMSIEDVRKFINDQKALLEAKVAEEKKHEDDVIKLFQVIA